LTRRERRPTFAAPLFDNFFRPPFFLHGENLSSPSPIPSLHFVQNFIPRAFYGEICVHCLPGRYSNPVQEKKYDELKSFEGGQILISHRESEL
jgi:hypothetical protein